MNARTSQTKPTLEEITEGDEGEGEGGGGGEGAAGDDGLDGAVTKARRERESEEAAAEKRRVVQKEAEEARERSLDTHMRTQMRGRVKITLLTGEVGKALARKELKQAVHVATVGKSDLHAIKGKGLRHVMVPGGALCVESARYMVEVEKDKMEVYNKNMATLLKEEGFAIPEHPKDPTGFLLARLGDQL